MVVAEDVSASLEGDWSGQHSAMRCERALDRACLTSVSEELAPARGAHAVSVANKVLFALFLFLFLRENGPVTPPNFTVIVIMTKGG